jgi:hypothetical protein
VTAHAGARTTHAVWQGGWYSLSGDTAEYYPNLERITGYGSVTGLKGANCRHDFYPVIPGISEPTYTKEQLANIDPPPQTVKVGGKDVELTYYELTQHQRAYERSIRARRRDVAAASGIVDGCEKGTPEYEAAYRDFQAASLKLRDMRTAYKDFSERVGLLTRNERTQAYGFNRSISAKAVWARKKAENISEKGLDNLSNIRYTNIGQGNMIEQEIREDSRYGRDKSTAINHTYIDSGEYRRKYDNISDNIELNRNLYQSAKKMLNHRSGTDFEDMYWFDGNTGKEFTSIIDMTEPSVVKYSPDFLKKYRNINFKITIHNHPRSTPPSIGDFQSAYRNGYSEGIIACHDGKIFAYSNIKEPTKDIYDVLINEFMAAGYSEYTAQIKTLNEMSNRGLLRFREVK